MDHWKTWGHAHGWQVANAGGVWDAVKQGWTRWPDRVFGWTFHLGPLKVCFGHFSEKPPLLLAFGMWLSRVQHERWRRRRGYPPITQKGGGE